ncbi:MAG: hypothetical protein H7Y18_17775 [Clostridiaceae bacterium]|nr:hypothetical protein [Clostridiaceae bacterium]
MNLTVPFIIFFKELYCASKGWKYKTVEESKDIRVKQNCIKEKIIGIDKGYRCLIATSENNFYGENLNEYLSKKGNCYITVAL